MLTDLVKVTCQVIINMTQICWLPILSFSYEEFLSPGMLIFDVA